MKLVYEKAAIKGLTRIQPKLAAAFRRSLTEIAQAPFARHANVKALTGVQDGFRFRRGDWRAVYRLDRASDTMIVVWIGARGGAYP